MRWIYLSPHLDDAVLSAGGLIYEQTRAGIPVEIWTFMCGDPQLAEYSDFAKKLHADWGFADAAETVQQRRVEDKNAAAIVGAAVVHFDFLDCIYRGGRDGRWLYSEISIPPFEEDAGIPARIAETVSARLQPDDVLVCQLSVGSHVDHVLVRMGAELLGRPLVYDIDIPYLFYKPQELAPKSAGMRENVHSITETGLQAWQDAVLAYTSQLPVLGDAMKTPEMTKESIRAYWAERRGIRLLQSVTSSK